MGDAAGYTQEIRDYLLGRVGRNVQSGTSPTHTADGLPAPVRRWWMLEGKRYAGIHGPLANNWPVLARLARRLLTGFSPRWRVLDAPEGRVDWTRTIQQNASGVLAHYVCDTSHIGLSQEELRALRGWISWIVGEWRRYCSLVGRPEVAAPIAAFERLMPIVESQEFDLRSLRRFAHTARRSRWPLLRNVVAESLRSYLEPQELDQLPLPGEGYQIFELLCLVRVLRCFAPRPESIRWLLRAEGNRVGIPGLTAHYQYSIGRKTMLTSSEFAGPLAAAMDLFKVRAPDSVDVLVDLRDREGAFDAIVIEVKSGSQGFDAPLLQLKGYSAALHDKGFGRLLVWGLVENPTSELTDDRKHHLASGAFGSDDVWVFSGADEIAAVLTSAGVLTHEIPATTARTSETQRSVRPQGMADAVSTCR